MSEQVPITVVSDYDGFIEALIALKYERSLTDSMIEELELLPDGWLGKIFGPARIKNVGPKSFDALLNVLAVDIVFVPNPERLAALERRRQRLQGDGKRERPAQDTSREAYLGKKTMKRVTPAVLRSMSKQGNEARNAKVSPERRSQIASRAGRARWKRRREARRLMAAASRLDSLRPAPHPLTP